MSAITQAGLSATANWVIFGGGSLVLVGSYRQAKGELTEAWRKLTDDDKAEIEKHGFGVFRGALRFGDNGAFARFTVTLLVWWLSFFRTSLKTEDGKKALDSATAWGAILLGSVFATVAAAYQSVVLTWPHI